MPSESTIPVRVFGGQGYVAGEVLRLLALHPAVHVACVSTTSQAGESVVGAFPHLAGTRLDGIRFVDQEEAATAGWVKGRVEAMIFATPHGATSALIDRALTAAESAGAHAHAIDLSADYRFRDADVYASIYGKPHAAPHRLAEFVSTVPEFHRGATPRHAAQPGCFTTAATTAAYPFVKAGIVEGPIFVAAITGSSGSGRTPVAGTHHPERAHNLYAYNALAHRHEREMRGILGAAAPDGQEPDVEFVPHSGPFVRGIHATVRMTMKSETTAEAAARIAADAYEGSPFVRVGTSPPKLTEVVATNRVRLGVAVRGRTLVVTSVIDNLTKGAAGGGIQWMNRVLGLPESTGLLIPGPGWI